MKLTPWFPEPVKPVHPGFYIVDQSWSNREVESVFAYWDGTEWYPQGSTLRDAMYTMCYGPKKGRPFKRWRGLRKE